MTKKQLTQKVTAMIKADQSTMIGLIEKAIKSGCMDIDGAEDNFILPKKLITAIYKDMATQRTGLSDRKQFNKEVDQIYAPL